MSETIFFNAWHTDSRDAQQSLLSRMRSETKQFAGKPGFLSLAAFAGQDDNRVLVEARWVSKAHFQAAVVDSPEAKTARSELDKLGRAESGFFEESFFLGAIQPEATIPPDRTQFLRQEVSTRWAALGFSTQLVALHDVELHVATGGTGSPVVLLHGYPESGEIWRFVAPELAKTHQVIVPDLRGMGLSGVSDAGYDLPSLADDIHELLARLNLERADVVGHDWGGAVGAVFALRHRSKARSLAFIESAVGGAGFEKMWAFDRPNPAMTFIPFVLAEGLFESLATGREEALLQHLWNTFTFNKDRLPFEAWQPYIDAMKRPGVLRSSATYYRSIYGATDAVRALIDEGKITIPVLSVSGQVSLGAAQKSFVETFASNITKHVTIEGSGHFVAEEQPEALIGELRRFLGD